MRFFLAGIMQGSHLGPVIHNQNYRPRIKMLLAFVPEASMGTAIEMWHAHQQGKAVVTISPLEHNWAVKFLSHAWYRDLEAFEAALCSGRLAERLAEISGQ